MIELHHAVSDKAGKVFNVLASAITMIECSEPGNETGGAVITVGGARVAVTESRKTVLQRCS
jgi:hypothetical protein